MLLRGIDVSSYQGAIDWDILRQARRDIAFAYVRAAEWRIDSLNGGLLDVQAERNLSLSTKNGILSGIYQRANLSINTPEKEAAEFVAHLRYFDAWKYGNLIPAIDIEYTTPQANAPNLDLWVSEFIDAYFDMSPLRQLIFYSSSSYIQKYYPSVIGREDVNIWVAHTEKYSIPKGLPAEEWAGKAPNFNGQGLIHQYSHSTVLPGITENVVDANCLFPDVSIGEIII